MKYLLAIDQGTSSTRAALYDTKGRLITISQYSVAQNYPHPGWIEQDPEEIWQKTLLAIKDVVKSVQHQTILACGITNQRETTVVWHKKSRKILAPAIVWQDRRTAEYCQSLADHSCMIQAKTGLLLDAYFSASKLNWLLTHYPRLRSLAQEGHLAFGTIDSFLIDRLTNGQSHVTDITNASRTLLYNIHEQKWDETLLDLFDIPASVLPDVLDSDGYFGQTAKEVCGVSIPITGVAGDQQAALIGQRCFNPGMLKITFGTGAFLLLNTGSTPIISKHRMLTTVAYKIDDQIAYGLEGNIYQAGSTIKWLRDKLKLINSSSETESLARSLPGNEGVYLIPAFSGLGAPHWLHANGGAITGLTHSSHAAHFARAALESVCYQTRDVLECLRDDSELELSSIRVDGGMTVNKWFLNFLASQCRAAIQRSDAVESTALGAAILAGIGCKEIDIQSLNANNWSKENIYSPSEEYQMVEADYNGWKNALNMFKNNPS